HIGGWFWNAAAQTRIHPVEQPEYGYELPEGEGRDWRFTATVAVQAKPELPDWSTLEVPAAEPEIPAELVEQALQEVQATAADLAPVGGRRLRSEGERVRFPRGATVRSRERPARAARGRAGGSVPQRGRRHARARSGRERAGTARRGSHPRAAERPGAECRAPRSLARAV